MMPILKAGVLYFALVFGAGFVLGPFRILWLVPHFGTRTAELLEMRKSSRSMDAVTTLALACRAATTPAAVSMSLMITPPWILPAGLASCGFM